MYSTKQKAKIAGQTRYQGTICRRGHSGIRHTSNGECVDCGRKARRKSAKKFRENNRELVRQRERECRKRLGPTPKNKVLLRSARGRARLKKLEFTLTQKWIDARIDKGCVVTGWVFDMKHRGTATARSPSIDRLNSERGYTPDNCRLVCWIVNRARGNFGDRLFFSMCRAIIRKQHAQG